MLYNGPDVFLTSKRLLRRASGDQVQWLSLSLLSPVDASLCMLGFFARGRGGLSRDVTAKGLTLAPAPTRCRQKNRGEREGGPRRL